MNPRITPRHLHAVGIALWLLGSTIGAQPASAHSASQYYSAFWPQGSLSVPWRFTTGITNISMRDRAKDGATLWNQEHQPLTFNFESGASDYSQFDGFSCSASRPFQKNAVHWQSFSASGRPAAVAETFKCISSVTHTLLDTQLIANSDIGASNFYSGTGSPASNQYDSWSVFAHEFGHMGGWSLHFTKGSSLCNGSPATRMTMCEGLNTDPGATWRRTLNTHDQDTFNNAY